MDDEFDDADFVAAVSAAERKAPVPLPRGRPIPNTASTSTSNTTTKVVQPTPQALPQRHTASALLVSLRQKGNPLLTHIHSIPWEYTDTPADYVLGATSCALFLSLKYHRLHPEYVYTRMKSLGKLYDLRILLVLVDIEAHEEPLRELAKTSLINNYTLILSWTAKEAARYLEAYKSMERAAPTAIKGQQTTGYADKMVEFITVPRGVNKSDAVGVVSAFGSIRAAVNAHPEELAAVQGWGEIKVKRWAAAVREPFRADRAAKKQGLAPSTFTSVGLQRTQSSMSSLDNGMDKLNQAEPVVSEPVEVEDDLPVIPEQTKEVQADTPNPSRKRRHEDPELNEGIASALAKYRSG